MFTAAAARAGLLFVRHEREKISIAEDVIGLVLLVGLTPSWLEACHARKLRRP